jgi:integrase/recombinase XerD
VDAGIIITEFKRYLKAAGYADATLESYRKNLDLFYRYLKARNIFDMRKITRNLVLDYQQSVMAQSIAMESKALKIRPVKRLFEHLVETHRLLINPTEGLIETCRKNRKLAPVLTLKEVKQLLAQPDLSFNAGIRDRAIMEVLYATAIRLSELLALEVYHVDFSDKVLFIENGKGRTQRVVPLGKTAAARLREYLKKIRGRYARKKSSERHLFLLNTGRALTASCVRTNLRLYRIRAGIKKPVSPHTFRRTCATHLLQAGVDIRYIQKLLGHRHLRTTQAYTRIMPREVKKVHVLTHPGAGL